MTQIHVQNNLVYVVKSQKLRGPIHRMHVLLRVALHHNKLSCSLVRCHDIVNVVVPTHP